MIINTNANLNFSNDSALGNVGKIQPINGGGAIYLLNSTFHVNTYTITFYGNRGTLGGAMHFVYGTMYIKSNTSVMFITNTAQFRGGVIYIDSGVPPPSLLIILPSYTFSTTLHIKEVLSTSSHHRLQSRLDISRVFSF